MHSLLLRILTCPHCHSSLHTSAYPNTEGILGDEDIYMCICMHISTKGEGTD